MMKAFPPSLMMLVILVSGCASAGSQSGGGGMDRPITQEEILETEYDNAYDVVRALRPRWLRPRGGASIELETDVQVYVNGVRRGGTEELRELTATGIQQIRYYDAGEATMRFGTGHGSGVIEVIL